MIRLPPAAVLMAFVFVCGCAGYNNLVDAAGRAYYRGDDKAAIDYSTRALEDPNLRPRGRAAAYETRGIEFLILRRYDLAEADLNSAIQLAPENRAYRLMRGLAYRRAGEYDKAVADYDVLLDKVPRDRAGAYAYRNRAAAYVAMGRPDLAVPEYTSWIEHDEQAPRRVQRIGDVVWTFQPPFEADDCRCFTLAVSGQPEEALRDCDAALRAHPGNYNALDTRAYVYWKLQRYPQALQDYEQVLRRMPGLSTALYGRGMVKLAMGDSVGGSKDVNAAKKLDPGIEETIDKMRNWLEMWIVPSYPEPS